MNRVVAENSFHIINELEDWAVAEFPRDAQGRYIVSGFHPKGKFMAEMRGDIKPVFEQLLKDGRRGWNGCY